MYCVLTAVRLLQKALREHSSKQRKSVKRNYTVYSHCGVKVGDGKWNCKRKLSHGESTYWMAIWSSPPIVRLAATAYHV